MKKVGIVTWSRSLNYGTNLQAYALFHKLKMMNFDCYFVKPFNNDKVENWGLFTRLINFGLTKIRPKKQQPKLKSVQNFQAGNHPLKIEKNKIFALDNFKYYPRISLNSQKKKLVSTTDYFLTGSDQIWNPYHSVNTFYMLDFVDDETKKIAYASSIGVNNIPEKFREIYKHYLSRFDSLALREKEGAEIIGELTQKEVKTVLDPTFLLTKEEWYSFAENALLDEIRDYTESYIFCYFVGNNPEYWNGVYAIQEKLGIKNIVIVPLEKSHYNNKVLVYETAGNYEFVHLIKNAKLILTDSFHATALSINMQKDFVEFLRFSGNDPESQNSRIYNLLRHYELEERIYKNDRSVSYKSIDYNKTNKILEQDREKSLRYLTNALT